MVIASYFFYGWWDWHYVFLLGGSTIANQLFAELIAPSREPVAPCPADRGSHRQPRRARVLQVLRLLRHLGREQLQRHRRQGVAAAVPDHPADRHLVLHVPGAVVRRSTHIGARSNLSLSSTSPTYLSFFPHLVAGPIVRASEFLPQLQGATRPSLPRRQPRVPAHRRGHVQEGRRVELPRRRDRR